MSHDCDWQDCDSFDHNQMIVSDLMVVTWLWLILFAYCKVMVAAASLWRTTLKLSSSKWHIINVSGTINIMCVILYFYIYLGEGGPGWTSGLGSWFKPTCTDHCSLSPKGHEILPDFLTYKNRLSLTRMGIGLLPTIHAPVTLVKFCIYLLFSCTINIMEGTGSFIQKQVLFNSLCKW